MVVDKIHDLDDSVEESFEFRLKGHLYRFRHMNTEEMESLRELEGKEEDQKDFIYKFISKVDEKSPDFAEVSKQMILPHWKKFKKMMEVEMGNADGNN